MTPVEFLDRVVRPNVAEFNDHYGDERRAYNAVAAVDALAAHFYVWCRQIGHPRVANIPNDSDFRASLARLDPSFQLLRDAAKAQKHVKLTQGNPTVSRADQIEARSLGWGEMKWGEGRWGGPPQVVIGIGSDNYEYVETIVQRSLEFLMGEMRAAGLAV